jgi:hypothetical protein
MPGEWRAWTSRSEVRLVQQKKRGERGGEPAELYIILVITCYDILQHLKPMGFRWLL